MNAIGDEHLATVQHPSIAGTTRSGAKRRHIRARVWLGYRNRGDLFTGNNGRHVSIELSRAASMREMRRSHVRMDEHGRAEPAEA